MPEAEQVEGPSEPQLTRFRQLLSLASLLMLILSWPLWLPGGPVPRVPFLSPSFVVPSAVSQGITILGGMALVASLGTWKWRTWLALALCALLALVLLDQHRLQPWALQFLVVGLLLSALPPDQALKFSRWSYVALYFHSGLSKLDVSFRDELGPVFLSSLAQLFKIPVEQWPAGGRSAAIGAMPLWEVGTALLLLFPFTRRFGVATAAILHLALIGVLGPWSLDHSTIVLVWNGAMLLEVACLFWPCLLARRGETDSAPCRQSRLRGAMQIGVKAVFWGSVLLPLGERWGWLDTWPSHGLYASHAERTELYLHDSQRSEWPDDLVAHLEPTGLDEWRKLNLTSWSRAVRGVPVYPQGRACNGLAESLSERRGGPLLVKVVQWSRAELRTGRRKRVECLGAKAIRRQGDQYWLNAHPTPQG